MTVQLSAGKLGVLDVAVLLAQYTQSIWVSDEFSLFNS